MRAILLVLATFHEGEVQLVFRLLIFIKQRTEAFLPQAAAASHGLLPSYSALIYLPGWSFTQCTKAITPLCQ
jgi:hypothetical protein